MHRPHTRAKVDRDAGVGMSQMRHANSSLRQYSGVELPLLGRQMPLLQDQNLPNLSAGRAANRPALFGMLSRLWAKPRNTEVGDVLGRDGRPGLHRSARENP